MLGAPPFLVNIFPSVMLAGSRSSQNVSEKEILQRLLLATAEGFHNLAAVPVCFVRNVSFAIPQDQPHNQVQCTSKCVLNTHTFYRIPLRPVAGSTLFSTCSYTFHWMTLLRSHYSDFISGEAEWKSCGIFDYCGLEKR